MAFLGLMVWFQDDRVDALIRKLGSEQYEEREAATDGLAAIGPAINPRLRARLRDSDPEIAARSRILLEHLEGMERSLRISVLCDNCDYVVSLENDSTQSLLFMEGPGGFGVTGTYKEGTIIEGAGVAGEGPECRLTLCRFFELAPGRSKVIGRVSSGKLRWTLDGIEITNDYLAERFKARCPMGCDHDDPEQPFNRAVNLNLERVWRPWEEHFPDWMDLLRLGAREGELGRARREALDGIIAAGRPALGRLVEQIGSEDLGLARASVNALNEIVELLPGKRGGGRDRRTDDVRPNNQADLKTRWAGWLDRDYAD